MMSSEGILKEWMGEIKRRKWIRKMCEAADDYLKS